MILRPPVAEDIPALAAHFAAVQKAYGTGGATEGEIRDWLAKPADELEGNYRILVEGDELVGWANIWDPTESHERLFIDLRVYPRAPSVIQALLDWGEARARELGKGGSGRVLASAADDDSLFAEALRARGFEVVRHFFRMEIAHDEPVADPVWPDEIVVRTFRPADARAVYETANEAFADHWDHFEIRYDEWLRWGPQASDFDPGLWFLAEEHGDVVGVALCRPSREPGAGHVAVLAVRRPWRRRGLGRALLLHAVAELKRRGFGKTELGVDAENLTGAVRLYEQAGMRVAKRFDICEKRLDG